MMELISYCRVLPEGISVNGAKVYAPDSTESWQKDLYTALGLNYPKFHKMDNLSKCAVLGFEAMKQKGAPFADFGDDEIALIFANSASSRDTDERFTESYEKIAHPSPSLFVYTLPNIVMGEMSILNKWYGENVFFIRKTFDAAMFTEQISIYLSKGNKACFCGWIDHTSEGTDCFLFLVRAGAGHLSPEQLNTYYKQYRNE